MNVTYAPPSGNPYIDSLAVVKWDGTTITYSFPDSATRYGSYGAETTNNFAAFTDAQAQAARSILASISTFTNLTFVELTGEASADAILRYANSDEPDTAYAYLPSPSPLGGDLWFRNTGVDYDLPSPGNYAWHAILHETGHALGLTHPHESDPPMPLNGDFLADTVMSYKAFQGDTKDGYGNEEWGFPQSYMMYDIASLQYLYGANYSYNAGDTTYKWSPTTGELFINGVSQGVTGANRIFMTVWDGGGTDTFDFSNYNTGATIDIGPGGWTRIYSPQQPDVGGPNPGNIATALLYQNDPRALIENVVGTGGDDTITGNAANNVLSGGAGSDTINGGDGNDVLYGGSGNNTLGGGNGNDTIYGGDEVDWITGGAGNDTIFGGGGDDRITGGTGADYAEGGDGNDDISGGDGSTLYGGAGNDRLSSGANSTLYGGTGNDTLVAGGAGTTLIGGTGDDSYTVNSPDGHIVEAAGEGIDSVTVYFGSSESYSLADNLENVSLATGQGVIGNALNNVIGGNAGNNVIDGGLGADAMNGGAGNDVYYVDNVGDTVDDFDYDGRNGGTDTIYASANFIFSEKVTNGDPYAGAGVSWFVAYNRIEFFNMTGSADLSVTGNDGATVFIGNTGNNTINAGGGNDTVTGGLGADTLAGGSGADTFVYTAVADSVAGTSDLITDFASGQDRIDLSAIAYRNVSLQASGSLTTLTLEAASGGTLVVQINGAVAMADLVLGTRVVVEGQVLRGTDGPDVLTGGAGDDYLVGGGDADRMDGGAGNDTYYVDNAGDVVIEGSGQGNDRVQTSVSYLLGLGAEVEVLETSDWNGTGAIELGGSDSANTIYGNQGANVLRGNGGGDVLWGYGGNDALDGGTGADVMWGGAGDDTYYVDNSGDVIFELAGEGYDRVAAQISLALPDNAEIELLEAVNLSATTAMDLAGSDTANTIRGNDGVNVLRGLAGDDVLWGFGGNDFLDGGSGADTMWGGTGDDTYYVDNSGDRIFEAAGEGNDRVAAVISLTLPDTAEIELLEAVNLHATTAMDLGGSDTANIIRGNDGVNVIRGFAGNDALYGYGGNDYLDGGTGKDAMYGGAGDDTYYVDNSEDYVYEAVGQGTDRIATTISLELSGVSEVEILEAINSAGTEALVLTGSDFANTISGNAGDNVLNGRGGSDVLTGYAGADTFQFTTALGAGNIDQITDFQHGTDKIALSHSVFSAFNPGSLDPASFHIGTAAADADDRIIYDPATGALSYDADGNGAGAAVQFATLTNHPATISAGDFLVM